MGIRSLAGARLARASRNEGLLFLGIAQLTYPNAYQQFKNWLRDNRLPGLEYLDLHSDIRKTPGTLLPGARAAIILALPYFAEDDTDSPKIALYAQYRDYHRVLRTKAERIARDHLEMGSFRIAVDSAPILERALAAQTARGFIGKNTLFIHPEHGSFLLLAEILTTEGFETDVPAPLSLDHKTKDGGCGPCRLCQSACPTGALDRNYTLDASKCLAYWTIENRGPIPERFWPHLARYYFGCDLCQLACPYNRKAEGPAHPPTDWSRRRFPAIDAVAVMTQAQYESFFGGTPLTRAKRNGLRRNALIAMAVTRHPQLQQALARVEVDGGYPLEETRDQILGSIGTGAAANRV